MSFRRPAPSIYCKEPRFLETFRLDTRLAVDTKPYREGC